MNYTLNQLRIFIQVAEKKSITRASEVLNMTQPAVSIQLKNLQSQFDNPLIQVVNRRVYLTEFGNEILESAKKIMLEAEGIQNRTLAFQGELSGKLRFSVVSTGKYIAPYFITDFKKKNKFVDIVMDVTNKARVIDSLRINDADFSFVSVLPERLKCEHVELMQNQLFLVGNGDFNLRKRPYDKQIFDELPIIFREKGSGTRHILERYLQRNHIDVNMSMELTSNEAVKQAVIAGLGFSIMPLIGIKNELQNGQLKIIPVKGFPVLSQWYLIWQKDKSLTPAAKAYLHFVKEEKDRIIGSRFEWYSQYAVNSRN